MSIQQMFNQTLASQRKNRVRDGAGGWTESLTPHLSGVACASRPAGRKEELLAAQLQATVSHVVYTLATVDVKRDDELALSGGLQLRVLVVLEPGDRNEHYEIMCEAAQRGR